MLCIIGCLSIGIIGGVATASGVNDWFATIEKPSFNPLNYLFGPVWSCLYMLMGVSVFLILQATKSDNRINAIRIFCFQLVLNFCWSFIFFKFHQIGWAFVEIIFIWLSILVMIWSFLKINKTAAYLQIPYFLWVSFASVLNGSLWILNLDK